MGIFARLFGKGKPAAAPLVGKKYEYPTCRAEFAMRIQRGEQFPEVMDDMQAKWRAGNEYLWDDYAVESLIDTQDKWSCPEHQLLYTRILLYRSIRTAGQDVRGTDPIEFCKQAPDGFKKICESFPPAVKERYASKTGRTYDYVTGNLEWKIRCDRGEAMPVVSAEIMAMWTPGNEYLWDDYDPESLIDTSEKYEMAVNQLLYSRIAVYRALREMGIAFRGTDPFEVANRVPDLFERLRARFPETTGRCHAAPSDPT